MKVLSALLWAVCLVRLCSAGWFDCLGGSKTVTLDLASPDKDKLNMTTKDDKELKSITYEPKSGHISSVVDAGKELWKPEVGQKCLLAKFLSKGSSSLLVLFLETSDKYFEKNDNGEWISIEKKDYEKKLDGLKSGMTTTSSSGSLFALW
ncbi:signal peptide-containing protein [Theileria equi strain WA]|uniref:Signal peptide-containing protein n=1 Tax=Theileria equi strain WA TaxID=1537102 RepID=L0AW12_THEEQ|nr:signal peptide-containing protein [Theileria equi strain WA]AFZ79740.1 signal peptide-containing protein [Theileria equi strain WA]|eukprot:XP_004829406.1 signal peptide-containing protein [Theileria equi strain WA]